MNMHNRIKVLIELHIDVVACKLFGPLPFSAIAVKELIYVDSDLTLFYIHWCEFTQGKCTGVVNDRKTGKK